MLLDNKSHEIRTLMTRIIGMTDLTLMTELTEEQRDYLTIVKSSTGLLLKVLNDIMDYSKIQAGKVNLEQVPFDIRETIYEVVELFQVAAKQKNIYLRLNSLDKIIPKNLIGDSIRLKQVLSNLVGNSVRFTNHGEVTIKVELEELDGSKMHLKFIVSDTGIGIPEDKLVELMDGDIYVESKEGVGSKFCFTAVFGLQEEGGSYHRNNNRSGGR
jgi:signal transduction histidine kinase